MRTKAISSPREPIAVTVERDALHQGLRQLAAGSRDLGPVAVKATAPNQVTLAAHGRRVSLAAVVTTGGMATVSSGTVLRRLVAKLAPGAVSLSSDPARLVIRSGAGVFRLTVGATRARRGDG